MTDLDNTGTPIGQATYVRDDRPASYAPEVFVDGAWTGNGLRFASEDEAEAWGRDLLMRWFVPSDSRAVASDDAPNYRLVDGKAVAL